MSSLSLAFGPKFYCEKASSQWTSSSEKNTVQVIKKKSKKYVGFCTGNQKKSKKYDGFS